MIYDPTFWFLIAFLTFFALLGKTIWKLVTSALDERAKKIEEHIDSAVAAREKAQSLLNAIKTKYKSAEEQAQEIIAHAKLEADRLRAESEKEINTFLIRRQEQVEQRIKTLENLAIDEIKKQAIAAGLQAATSILRNKIDDQTDEKVIEEAIAGLKKQNFRA